MEKITRKEQKERTRANLIQEATFLFAKNGIGSTTTAEVAKSLAISHGTVFVHFPTRDELVLGVVERFGERLSEELRKNLGGDLQLKEMLRAHLTVLSDFEDFYLRLISESQTLPTQIRSLVYAMNSSLSYQFYRLAQKQMKAGSIKKLRQAEFFTTWMALLHYHILNRDLLSEKTPILKHKGEDILRLFFSLIKKEK